MDKHFAGLMARAEIGLKGRLFNWRTTAARRNYRDKLIEKVGDKYMPRFLSAAEGVEDTPVVEPAKPETIFSLWLQGEQAAPPLIKACVRSIRHNCPEQRLLMLDEKTVLDYIDLPGVIMDKRRRGKISHAHFADIARVELLHNHGGYWMDGTLFATGKIPANIEEHDFFVYLAGNIRSFTCMQNYFIRAKKGAYLLEAWRAMILDYWTKEPRALEYFMHQSLFKTLVRHNPKAAARFAEMPHINQHSIHAVWWALGPEPFDKEQFGKLTADSFFQKTTYSSPWAKNPPPGSFADEMINRMYI